MDRYADSPPRLRLFDSHFFRFPLPFLLRDQRAAQRRRRSTQKVRFCDDFFFFVILFFFRCLLSIQRASQSLTNIWSHFSCIISIIATLLSLHYYVDSPSEPSGLHREVLLSYRFLFGQSSSSRKLFGQLLNHSSSSVAVKAAAKSGHHFITSSNVIIDDSDLFLAIICISPFLSRKRRLDFSRWGKPSPLFSNNIFPFSALDLNGQLQESETYSTRDDFTVFGPRLLTLQHYNMRQQPSKVKDLWRDRRNPLQWYTFWAVLLIGDVSILLAMLQLLINVVQLYFIVWPLP